MGIEIGTLIAVLLMALFQIGPKKAGDTKIMACRELAVTDVQKEPGEKIVKCISPDLKESSTDVQKEPGEKIVKCISPDLKESSKP